MIVGREALGRDLDVLFDVVGHRAFQPVVDELLRAADGEGRADEVPPRFSSGCFEEVFRFDDVRREPQCQRGIGDEELARLQQSQRR